VCIKACGEAYLSQIYPCACTQFTDSLAERFCVCIRSDFDFGVTNIPASENGERQRDGAQTCQGATHEPELVFLILFSDPQIPRQIDTERKETERKRAILRSVSMDFECMDQWAAVGYSNTHTHTLSLTHQRGSLCHAPAPPENHVHSKIILAVAFLVHTD
jgi:hypothetical protein